MVLASSVPYLWFWLQTPPGHRYTWILPPYPEDSFGYMAWSQQAAHGRLLFQVKYTALPQTPFLFHPFFLVCGWLSRLLAVDIGIVHWAVKAIGVVLFFLVFYHYNDWLGLGRVQSVVASVLLGVSSGFGTLFVHWDLVRRWQIAPADLWMPEVSTYWSLLWNPLFPYSLTLILLIICWLDRGTRSGKTLDFWLGGLATGVLALVHPYALPMLAAFAVILGTARRGRSALGLLVRFFLASFPFVLYVALLSAFEPVIAQHSAHGEMRSPTLASYLLGFGLPLLICAAGLVADQGHWLKRYWQVAAWFLLSLSFAYVPFWFQRKLIFGAQIPICILSGICVGFFLDKLKSQKTQRLALALAAVACAPLLLATSIYQLAYARQEIRNNVSDTYYISDEMLAGLTFLKDHSQPNDVVFATGQTSRLIPAFSGNTVLWGHWAMSVDLDARKQWYAEMFNQEDDWQDPRRSEQFWGTGIEYIYADGELRKSIEQAPERWAVILLDADKVFSNATVEIFRRHNRQP